MTDWQFLGKSKLRRSSSVVQGGKVSRRDSEYKLEVSGEWGEAGDVRGWYWPGQSSGERVHLISQRDRLIGIPELNLQIRIKYKTTTSFSLHGNVFLERVQMSVFMYPISRRLYRLSCQNSITFKWYYQHLKVYIWFNSLSVIAKSKNFMLLKSTHSNRNSVKSL